MKVITLEELETNFDAVLEDVSVNKEHYRILNEAGDVMLIPVESYEVLKEVYIDWVEEPNNDPPVAGFDPEKLPVEQFTASDQAFLVQEGIEVVSE
jgi:hypothetical protein